MELLNQCSISIEPGQGGSRHEFMNFVCYMYLTKPDYTNMQIKIDVDIINSVLPVSIL